MLIAIPSYIGVSPKTMLTVVNVSTRYGGQISTVSDCPWIDQARSELVGQFLDSSQEELLFIDSDVSFDVSLVEGMKECKSDIVTVSYRRRVQPFHWSLTPLTQQMKIKDSPMRNTDGGLRVIEIMSDGLGCCLIQRAVIEKMTENYPNLIYFTDEFKKRVNLFQHGVGVIDGKPSFIGEDRMFFARARASGFKVECLVDATIHHGQITDSLAREFDRN